MNVYDKLSNPVAFVVFVLTLVLPIAVGFWALRKTKDQADFFVGGRAMGLFVVALSAVSSGRSSWLVLGVSGMSYTMGLSAIWAVLGYATVEALQFIYLGKRLRVESQKMGAITLLDYFESRFEDRTHLIRIVGSIIICIFITAYVAAQFNAGAKTLSTALEIPVWVSLLAAGGLILVYMTVGGFVAVAYNDVIRAVIMLMGLVVLPVYGLVHVGGWSALTDILHQHQPSHLDVLSLGLGGLIGFLGIGLGSPGQPHILVRYMSIDDPQKLTMSAVIGTFWNFILGFGAVLVGLIGRAIVDDPSALPGADSEMIYLVLSAEYFGPVVYGVLVGGIFAAILSTADSQLLVIASTFVRDLYEQVIKKNAIGNERKKLMLSRWVVVASGVFAMVLAYMADDLVFWLVLFAWGGLGAAFGPSLIFSLYWKRTTKLGVVLSMIVGTSVTIIWKLFLKDSTGIYELIPAFFSAALVLWVTGQSRNS